MFCATSYIRPAPISPSSARRCSRSDIEALKIRHHGALNLRVRADWLRYPNLAGHPKINQRKERASSRNRSSLARGPPASHPPTHSPTHTHTNTHAQALRRRHYSRPAYFTPPCLVPGWHGGGPSSTIGAAQRLSPPLPSRRRATMGHR